jgi:hypothetical protein
MHRGVFAATAVCAIVWSGCGDLSEPNGSHDGDPTLGSDPVDPPDDTVVDPPDDTEPAVDYLQVTSGYFAAGFGYDAETEAITTAWYDDAPLASHITLILFEDDWTFDFGDPSYCMVQFTMDDGVAPPWMSGVPDLVFGVADNAATPGSTDCYDDSFHAPLDPAVWPDVIGLLGSDLGFGIAPRSERVNATFSADDAEDLDAVGLVGGVMSIPDLFVGGPLYRDAFAFSYAVDEDFDIAMDGEYPMHLSAEEVLASGDLPTGYYDLTSLDTWTFTTE